MTDFVKVKGYYSVCNEDEQFDVVLLFGPYITCWKQQNAINVSKKSIGF